MFMIYTINLRNFCDIWKEIAAFFCKVINNYSSWYPGYRDKASFLASIRFNDSTTDLRTLPGNAGHVRYTVYFSMLLYWFISYTINIGNSTDIKKYFQWQFGNSLWQCDIALDMSYSTSKTPCITLANSVRDIRNTSSRLYVITFTLPQKYSLAVGKCDYDACVQGLFVILPYL